MDALRITGGIFLIISAVLTIIIILCQESKESGMKALSGQADSYFSRNKGRTLSAKLVNITKVMTVAFFVLSIAMNLIEKYVK